MRIAARLRAVFNRWFWLNYAVCLLVTAPIPFTTITVNGEFVRRVAIWENYRSLLQGRFTAWPVGAVAAHLGVCFAMCFLVWLVLARPPAPAEAAAEDDNERD